MLLAGSAVLVACGGTAAVMKEEAAALSSSTTATIVGSRAFYAKLGTTRQDYLLIWVAKDPNCRLENPIYLLPLRDEKAGFRCLTENEAATRRACVTQPPGAACPPGGVSAALPQLQRFTPGDIEKSSALELVGLMAEYQALLAQIVVDSKFDATAKLTALQERINSIGTMINTVGASVAPLEFKAQIGAVGKLTNLVRTAIVDHNDLKALRRLMGGAEALEFEAALSALELRYKSIDEPLYFALNRYLVDLEQRQYNENSSSFTSEQRLARLRAWAERKSASNSAAAAPDILAPAFATLRKSHQELREAVVNENYTEAQRRKIAQKNLSQLKDWFQAIAGLISVL